MRVLCLSLCDTFSDSDVITMDTGDDSLMTSSELEEQRKWDEEFRRRSEDLQRMELSSRERRSANLF